MFLLPHKLFVNKYSTRTFIALNFYCFNLIDMINHFYNIQPHKHITHNFNGLKITKLGCSKKKGKKGTMERWNGQSNTWKDTCRRRESLSLIQLISTAPEDSTAACAEISSFGLICCDNCQGVLCVGVASAPT